MAAWTTLLSGLFAVGEPITSAIGIALAENPEAIAEGATGAPRLLGEAAARIGDGLATLTISAADTVLLQYGLTITTGTLLTASTTDVVASTYVMDCYTGTVRARASHLSAGGSSTSTLSLFKNGVLVNSWTNTTGSYVERTQDVTFVVGDTLEWRHKSNSALVDSQVALVAMRANDGYVVQPLLIRSSNI